MKTWHDIIIYGNPNGGLPTEKDLHDWAKSKNADTVRILYYGLAVKGTCWGGDKAAGRMVGIVELSANDADGVVGVYDRIGWNRVVACVRDSIFKGTFNKRNGCGTFKKNWKKYLVQCLGKDYGVACLYDFNDTAKTTKIFTYGDKRKTVKMFNTELCGEVTAKFKDLSGNGIPQEFSIQDGSINVKMAKDGKVRLCFAVHMKADKKDFADVKLQTKINELRKEVSTKYGVDIDIVDIRSTIEYV